MLITTRASSAVRFNPNLYSCGKVTWGGGAAALLLLLLLQDCFFCSRPLLPLSLFPLPRPLRPQVCLSLLGTWEGPGWEPGTSNLYQVLQSIQSLIMNKWPIENEPGLGPPPPSTTSEDNLAIHFLKATVYNFEVRLGTLIAAMTEQLRKPPANFAAACKAHFSLKRWEVAAQAVQWCEEAVLCEWARARGCCAWLQGGGGGGGGAGGRLPLCFLSCHATPLTPPPRAAPFPLPSPPLAVAMFCVEASKSPLEGLNVDKRRLCKEYLTTGGACKKGANCKYAHIKVEGGASDYRKYAPYLRPSYGVFGALLCTVTPLPQPCAESTRTTRLSHPSFSPPSSLLSTPPAPL